MYAVNFTWFEKHSRFSLRPAERATHDNQLCFFKDWQCICPSPLQYTIYYGKSAVFSPCSYTSPSSISDWSCETQKKSNCINPLRWRAFCLRNMDERFHHLFTCVVTGPTNCGKTEFVAKLIQHEKQTSKFDNRIKTWHV